MLPRFIPDDVRKLTILFKLMRSPAAVAGNHIA